MHKGKGAEGEGKMNRGQEKWSYRRRGAKRARRGAKQGKRGKQNNELFEGELRQGRAGAEREEKLGSI